MLAAQLHTLHNLTFYHRLMEKLRAAIRENNFQEIYSEFSSQNSETARGETPGY